MSNVLAESPHAQFAADMAAVNATSFCSLWPTGKQVLQTLAGTVGNPFVKIAVSTVIAAGDALCSSSSGVGSTHAEVKAQFSAAGINSIDDLAREVVARNPVAMSANTWLIHGSYFFSPNN